MKIIQLHLCLLVWCGAAEGFSDKLVELGQNVTLDCEVSVKNVYWYLMKPMEPPVFILLSHSSFTTFPKYENPALNRTFSLQLNSSLFISNVTENELGIYYCVLNETPPKFSTGTRLQPTSESCSDRVNRTEGNQTCGRCPDETVSDQQILLTVSGLVNCVLLVVVTGVAVWHYKASPKLRPQSAEPNVQQQQNLSGSQHEEIELPTSAGTARQSHTNSTYALLQFPKAGRGA